MLLIVTTQEKRQIKLLDIFAFSANVLVHTGVVLKKRSYCICGVGSPTAGWYPTQQRHRHYSCAFDRYRSRIPLN